MSFVAKRLLGTLPSLAGVVVITFLLSHALPGDPAAYFAGPAANAASIASVRQTLGLDQPLPVQFLHYVGDLLRGDLGRSLTTGQPVLVDLAERLPGLAGTLGLRLDLRGRARCPHGGLGLTRFRGRSVDLFG